VKRLRNNGRVSLAVCNYSGKLVAGEILQGHASIVTDPDLIRRVYARFTHKYGWQFRLTNLLSRLAGRINQRAMIEITVPQ
jgi:PPOX class probable F420-dependent enzyme